MTTDGSGLLPPREDRAPSKAAAHGFHQHEIAFLDAMLLKRLIERQRNRGSRGVAVPVERDHDLLGRYGKLLCDTVQDALVGLMRHVEIDLVGGVAVLNQGLLDHAGDFLDGVAKYLAAVHAEMADGLGRARAAIDVEQVLVTAI